MLSSGARAIPEALTGRRASLLSESEVAAESLRRRVKAHWDAALPRRRKQTAEQAALDLLTELTKAPPKKGTLNSNIRDRLFDNWRERSLRRVAKDETLILDLEVQAGIVFAGEEAPSAFAVPIFRSRAHATSSARSRLAICSSAKAFCDRVQALWASSLRWKSCQVQEYRHGLPLIGTTVQSIGSEN